MIANIVTCIAINFLAADQYMSLVIPGQMYKDTYKKLNMDPVNLSRVLEDAGTLTSGIVPGQPVVPSITPSLASVHLSIFRIALWLLSTRCFRQSTL